MVLKKLVTLLAAFLGMIVVAQAQQNEDLVLCDCGIGDDKSHPTWSTSRQMNWYKSITWPDSVAEYPNAPDMAVEIPYQTGKYPWIPSGATGSMPNSDVWTVYIEDGTPDGFRAGTAMSTKNGKDTLNCWAYRGRPVSAAINHTVSPEAICWSAFVCNHDNTPPPRPKGMGSKTSTITTQTAAPTSFSSQAPIPTQPAPTSSPQQGKLLVSAAVNPRFLNWQSTWDAFMSNFVWDPKSGGCIGKPIVGNGYTVTITCGGIQIDQDSHMTLIMINALRSIGQNSLWFNQAPIIPGGASGVNSTSPSWVVMPEEVSLSATDISTNKVIGFVGYKTTYNGFISGPCSVCDEGRFNSEFFNPIIAALQGTYPEYYSYEIQAQCSPWMVC